MDADRDLAVAAVLAVDPSLGRDQVVAVVEAITPRREQRRLLAVAVSTDPTWCVGSVTAPVVVERLVAALGSTRVERPRCGTCGRAAHCVGRGDDGSRLCKACDHRRRVADCARCGRRRPVARRLAEGALCATCYRSHPSRLEVCTDCGEDGIVHRRRADGGPICPRCYMRRARALDDVPGLVAVCADCGRHGYCVGAGTITPRCPRCYPRRTATCAGCGRTARVAVMWAAGPHCHSCRAKILDSTGTCEGCGQRRRIDPRHPGGGRCSTCAGLEPLSTCATCGTEARLWDRGCCNRCTLGHRLDRLFSDADADVAEVLAPLRAALDVDDAHRATLDWLWRGGSGLLLARLFDGSLALSHSALDEVGSKAADHLRHLLVAAGLLTERDEALVQLESWIAVQLADIDDASDRHLVEAFATWQVLRRRRQSAARRGSTGDTSASRRVIRATVDLLVWLRYHRRRLEDITQADVDLWLASGPPARRSAKSFLRWAAARKVAPAVVIAIRPSRLPANTVTADQLQAVVRRLATDASLPTVERVGGLLVALYGQTATRVARLRLDDVSVDGDAVQLRLGRHCVGLPPVLGALMVELVADRRGPVRVGASPTSRWLFPGGRPGRPMTGDWLAARIAVHGLPVASMRNAALLELAGQLPAAFLADLLGISTRSAVRWTQAAGAEWAGYAGTRARNDRQ